jgi:CMP-N-acetylneuraminic acid synthetase
VPGQEAPGKEILKKNKKIFAGCQVRRHPAKKFFKKNKKIFAGCQVRDTRQRKLKK